MPDEPAIGPPVPALAEISSAMAPVIYFDFAPNFGFANGVASITLETVVYLSTGDAIRTERRAVAHLRMSAAGLANLKGAINGAELAAEPIEGKTAN